MDWLTFIAEVIKAIAWPLSAIVALLILRRHIVDMFPFLEKMKWKDIEVYFARRVRQVAKEGEVVLAAATATVDGAAILSGTVSREQQLSELAAIAPRAAVLEAWLGVERAAASAMTRKGLVAGSVILRTPRNLERALRDSEILTSEQCRLLVELRDLRNKAVHLPDFALSEADARDYVNVALQLERLLDAQGAITTTYRRPS